MKKSLQALQEEDKQLIRSKIAEVFAAGNAEQARRRFDKEVRGCGRAGASICTEVTSVEGRAHRVALDGWSCARERWVGVWEGNRNVGDTVGGLGPDIQDLRPRRWQHRRERWPIGGRSLHSELSPARCDTSAPLEA